MILLAALPLAAGCSTTEIENDSPYRIYGKLLDKNTGGPIKDLPQNCSVAASWSDNASVKKETAKPNEDMTYEIEVPSIKNLAVRASSDRYVNTKNIKVDISKMIERSIRVDINLDIGIIRKFRILSADTGKPIPDLEAEVRGVATGNYQTDARGEFTVSGIKPGMLNVRFSTEEYVDCTTYRFVTSKSEKGKTVIALPRGGEISGIVTGPDEKAMPGAKISLSAHTPQNDACEKSATSDSNGEFRIKGLPAMRSCKIEVEKPGFAKHLMTFYNYQLNEKRSGIIVKLVKGGSLLVTVIDADKKPLPDTRVHLYIKKTVERRSGRSISRSTRTVSVGTDEKTDADGRAKLDALEPAEYIVEVRAKGYDSFRNTSEVKAGETAELTFNLPRVWRFSGRVTNAKGEPVAGAVLSVSSMPGAKSGYSRSTRSDSKGNFDLVGVRQEPVNLRVASPDYAPFEKDNLKAADVKDFAVILEKCGSIEGVVKTPEPLESFTITVYQKHKRRPDDPFSKRVQVAGFADPDGKFKIDNVPAGTYRLVVLAKNYARTIHPEPVAVKNASATKDIEIELTDRGAALEFTVVKEKTGKPVEGARMQVSARKGLSRRRSESHSSLSQDFREKSAEDGKLWIRNLAAGIYYYTIILDNRTVLNRRIILLKEGEIHKFDVEVTSGE